MQSQKVYSPNILIFTTHKIFELVGKTERAWVAAREKDLLIMAGDLWTGGMETTLAVMRWAIIYLMQHQDVQQRLYKDISKVLYIKN